MFKQFLYSAYTDRKKNFFFFFLLTFSCIPIKQWACLELPETPPDMVVETCVGFDGFTQLRFLDYTTYGANTDDFCTCALNIPLQFGEVVAAIIVHAGTNTPVEGWDFVADADSDFGMGGTDWQGFSSELTAIIPLGLAVDVLFIIDPLCFEIIGFQEESLRLDEDESCCEENANDILNWFVNGNGLLGTDGANPDGSPGGDHFFVGSPGNTSIVFPFCDDGVINGDELGTIDDGEGNEINCGNFFCLQCELQFTELSDPCSCESVFFPGIGFRDTLTITVIPGDDAILDVNNGGFLQANGQAFQVGTTFTDGGNFDNDGIVNGSIIVIFFRQENQIADIVVNGVPFQSPAPCPFLSTCIPSPGILSCSPDQLVACASDIVFGEIQLDSICSLEGFFIDTTGPVITGLENCNGTTYSFQTIAEDMCGNIDTCMQVFTIQNDPPMITQCPLPVTVDCVVDFVPGIIEFVSSCDLATDTIVTIPDITIPICPGLQFLVNYEVVDECGQSSTCDQQVTIGNSPGIMINACPPATDISCATDIEFGTVDFSTPCDNSATVNISTPVINGEPNCIGTTYTVTYQIIDACDNLATCDQVFTIVSDQPIIVECPADEIVSCESDIRPGEPSFLTRCNLSAEVVKTGPVVNGEPSQDGTTYTYTFTVTDACGSTASCDQVFTIQNECTNLDFDALTPGTIVSNQFPGVQISSHPSHNPPMIFDTGNPTGNDFDVGTPNEVFGGPGVGVGFCNSVAQGNALIVSKDNNIPNETEGQLIFNFDCGVIIRTIDFIDMECGHNTVQLFDIDNDLIETIELPQYGENSFHTEIINIGGVYSMIVEFPCAGGAISDVVYCEDHTPGADCGLCASASLDFAEAGIYWPDDAVSGTFTNDFQTFDVSINDVDGIFENSEESMSGIQVGIEPNDVDDIVEIIYTLSEVSSFVAFDIVDLDFKDSASKQQEKVCICGINTSAGPGLIFPTLYSLDGSVEIDGNCAEATSNSAISHQDESILVKFEECIDQIIIKYGTGSNSPTADPSFSKIQIGKNVGFNTSKCPNDCGPCELIGDRDMDGICDDCDICLVGNDLADQDGDGIPDACDSDCDNSLDEGDDDLDGVCNIDDICPGGNDQIDDDGNGIPDACEECDDIKLVFGCSNEWIDDSNSGTFTVLEQTFDINIMDMDNILENTNQTGFGLTVGIEPEDVEDQVIIKYLLSEIASSVMFDIVDLDFKNGNSRQQEAVCIYGLLGASMDTILPTITSLDGSVAINGNVAEATTNSAVSGQDESIMVVFDECIDQIVIKYGSGSNTPTNDPDFSKITIGLDKGFKTTVCENECEPCADGMLLSGLAMNKDYQARLSIESEQTAVGSVTYDASETIALKSGFEVTNSATFAVKLDGCDNP